MLLNRAKWYGNLLYALFVAAVISAVIMAGAKQSAQPTISMLEASAPAPNLSYTPDGAEIGSRKHEVTSAAIRTSEGQRRGYLTTPEELTLIMHKAEDGIEPYRSAVQVVLDWAQKDWDYELKDEAVCINSDRPRWLDNEQGVPKLYARALAYQLTGEKYYAEEAGHILERIMTNVETISLDSNQCRLAFGWGTPELVASADLIEDYWSQLTCTGPTSTLYTNTEIGEGNCKRLFQNWLAKNPYYVVSYSATAQSNWGAAATNTTAYIADYLWNRSNIQLVHRMPKQINSGDELYLAPSEAFALANRLMFDRMNGYGVEYGSSASCDYLDGDQQLADIVPVKSQLTENGIVTEDARREEACNIVTYNGEYQNYPQLHLGHNIQQCELMLRRGNGACYDNVDNSNLFDYTFRAPDDSTKTTHLRPGRGSVERAIKAIIVDSDTEWRHDSALAVAYRYYYARHTLPGFKKWAGQLDSPPVCDQDICFGVLTHGFATDEVPALVPTVAAHWVSPLSLH